MLAGFTQSRWRKKQTPALFTTSFVQNYKVTVYYYLFVVVVYAGLKGTFQAHPGWGGIMTGLWSDEEEEFPLDHFVCIALSLCVDNREVLLQ